jgi:nucleoside-diphosphate-sugar epimerase
MPAQSIGPLGNWSSGQADFDAAPRHAARVGTPARGDVGLPARPFVSFGSPKPAKTFKAVPVPERFSVDRANFPGPVVVTGAGGCIGSWVLALLTRAGVPACALDVSEDKRRPRLLIPERDLERIQWRTGDIAEGKAVSRILEAVRPCAIVHLAALQVPFCKADPIAGAKVNVVGTVNIFEAARRLGIKRLAYASSIAAYGAMDEGHGAMHTLYGAYKYCDEQIAKVYSGDWGVHSIGIRPGVVYGVGRDQGLTSKTTVAILAAAAGKPYDVPFSGGVSWLYAGEVASAFIHAVARERAGAPVFDMNGVYAPVEEGLGILRKLAPSSAITSSGQPLAFPMHLPDQSLREYLGDYGGMPLAEGIRETYEAFRALIGRGALAMPEAA